MRKEKKRQQNGKRQLKVYYKHFDRAHAPSVTFPEIRLCGKWVRDTGFDCGQDITVSHKKDKIVITKGQEKKE